MAKDTVNNPFDPETLKKGLMMEPLIPMEYAGPIWKAQCSQFGQDFVNLVNETYGIKEAVYCHIFPEVNRREGVVTNITAAIAFDTSRTRNMKDSDNRPVADIWINGVGSANNDGRRRTVMDYKPSKTPSGKFGVSDKWKKFFGTMAANFDDSGKIVINEASKEQISRDRRFRNFAFVQLDFFTMMGFVLRIGDDDPYDFAVDFDQTNRKYSDGQEDCLMTVTKYVGRRKKNKVRYNSFDPSVMTSGIESMYGGNQGRRAR